MNFIFSEVFTEHQKARLEFTDFSGRPVFYRNVRNGAELTERVLCAQRVEQDVVGRHLEPSFGLLLLLGLLD